MPDVRLARDVDHHVARRMRERRTRLGLTLRGVAERIGTTEQQASKYERGLDRVSAGQLHRIAVALGVEPGYFFEGLGEPARPTAGQRRLLDLAQSFAVLPRRRQEALAELARALAGEADPAAS